MLVSVAGVGFDLAPGSVTERFAGQEAETMIARGYAVPENREPVEMAVREAAVEKRPRNRKRTA